jgi:copper chaperone CopZ
MMAQTLQIAAELNKDGADALTRTLAHVKGVNTVSFSPVGSRLSVTFDEDRTSMQELVATLERAGYPVQSGRKAHGDGSCCGSCGG